MKESMSITSSTYASALLTLPWGTPLEQWPDNLIAALPRGISRHIVRFVGINRGIVAVKEIGARTAHHEYKMLRELQRLGAPSVRPVAVITGRHPAEEDYGELTAALVTEHLEFSLPYREIFSRHLTVVDAEKLIRALSVLLVRMHLLNFYWGDVSLSNTLFRRDAETYSAYLVDAETGEFQPNLSESRRLYDVDIARVNIIGELMDLQAGECLDKSIDVIALGGLVESSYLELWTELTAEESVDASEYWRVSERIDRLNQLGFDIGELKVTKDDSRQVVRIRPVVVDPGHYRAELLSLTGLSVEEHQAQRLLGSIQAYQAVECGPHVGLTQAAHLWMTNEYEPTIAAVPVEMLDKLEPAQIFHERGGAVTLPEATASYLESVLPARRDEARLLSTNPSDEDLS